MKIRSILSGFAIFAAIAAYAATPYSLGLEDNLPEGTGFSAQTWDDNAKCWNLTGGKNDFDKVRPTVQCKPLTEKLDADLTVLAFDYKSDTPVGNFQMVVYNSGSNATGSPRKSSYIIKMPASEQWRTVRINIKAARGGLTKLGVPKQYITMAFMDLQCPSNMSLKNIRFEQDVYPLVEQNLVPGKDNLVEAENFNTSVSQTTHTSRYFNTAALPKYKNPVPGKFPIYAFTSVSFETVDEFEGVTGPRAWELLMQKKYKDLAEAGFNITEGCAYSGVDRAALFPGQTINTDEPIDLFEGLDLKIMLRAGLDSPSDRKNVVGFAKNSPRLAGYCIKDEPHVKDLDAMGSKLAAVRELDDEHLLYGNLLHINTVPAAIGASSYDYYVNEYVKRSGIGMLSYDYYAVRQFDQNDESSASVKLMPNFFQNLEVISKLAKYYNTSFWAFTRAMSSTWHSSGMENSVLEKKPYKYPAPKEEHMRVQAFSALLYGAQGLQYWPYMSCDGCNDAPITRDGTKNPAWYYAKNINTEVTALTWVFLGAEMLHVGHTNAQTPLGCLRLTNDMLPKGISSVTTSGNGMPVSLLQNEKNLFMMTVNPELFENQSITIKNDKAVKQVLPDGTTKDIAAGENTYDLAPGGYIIYLVDENATPIDQYVSTSPEQSNYRDDYNDMLIAADETASNGHYIADMGDNNWKLYSGITPESADRTISTSEAAANWGQSYTYTVNATEDMTVNIFVGHSVPWSDYGRVASVGAKPGISYSIENNPTLNWPKQYAASMTLSIDGVELTPANQPMRPAVPETFTEDGAEFNRILADKSQWVSTKNTNGTASNVLYFWPKQGGDNSFATQYNEKPDYQAVHLTKGEHIITINSLCYPWHFDNLKINDSNTSGIDNIVNDNLDAPVEWYNLQGIRINPETASPGLYLRRQGSKTEKIAL